MAVPAYNLETLFAVKSCKLKYKNIDYFLLKIPNWSGNKPDEKITGKNDKQTLPDLD